MVEAGVLEESEHVELVNGELVVVNPQGPVHRTLTTIVRRLLEAAYGPGFFVQDHSPVAGTADSIPEPDNAVVRGEPRQFFGRHPGPADVVLVVEHAYSSLALDRTKANIYATVGYGDYWIVDPNNRRVEVRRAPKDGLYTHTDIVDEHATLKLPQSDKTIAVRDLLP